MIINIKDQANRAYLESLGFSSYKGTKNMQIGLDGYMCMIITNSSYLIAIEDEITGTKYIQLEIHSKRSFERAVDFFKTINNILIRAGEAQE